MRHPYRAEGRQRGAIRIVGSALSGHVLQSCPVLGAGLSSRSTNVAAWWVFAGRIFLMWTAQSLLRCSERYGMIQPTSAARTLSASNQVWRA